MHYIVYVKHFKISEIFWIFNIEVLDILKLNIIQRHNFFQSFASIDRVDLVLTNPNPNIIRKSENFQIRIRILFKIFKKIRMYSNL